MGVVVARPCVRVLLAIAAGGIATGGCGPGTGAGPKGGRPTVVVEEPQAMSTSARLPASAEVAEVAEGAPGRRCPTWGGEGIAVPENWKVPAPTLAKAMAAIPHVAETQLQWARTDEGWSCTFEVASFGFRGEVEFERLNGLMLKAAQQAGLRQVGRADLSGIAWHESKRRHLQARLGLQSMVAMGQLERPELEEYGVACDLSPDVVRRLEGDIVGWGRVLDHHQARWTIEYGPKGAPAIYESQVEGWSVSRSELEIVLTRARATSGASEE